MASRSVLSGLFLLTIGLSAAFACSNYEPPDVANYGPPNGLSSKAPTAPAPTSSEDSGTPPPPANGDGGTTPLGDSGTPVTQLACVVAGGTLVPQTTPCTVSWSKDIYPNMQSGAVWNCAGSTCHSIPAQPPLLLPTGDAHSFYTTLANFTKTVTSGTGVGQPYFNPCSTDPTKSEFVCNVATSGYCGLLGMPLNYVMPAASATTIATWVACGAPEN